MSDFAEFFTRFLPDLLRGAGITLLLTAEGPGRGLCAGTARGVCAQYGSNSGAGWLSVVSNSFRGTPLLMQLFIIYYGLPGLGITFSSELSAFLALGFNRRLPGNTCVVPSWRSGMVR